MNDLPDDPIARELKKSARKIRFRHFLHHLVYLAVALQGVRWLYLGIMDILFVYPKIGDYYQMAGASQDAYMKIIGQAALVAITSFLETAFGLAMLVRKSHSIKNLHVVIGIIIFILSYYFKSSGISLDHELIKELSLITSLLKSTLSS